MVFDDWLLLQDSDTRISNDIRCKLAAEFARLAISSKDGHLNSNRIDIDADSLVLSLNDDNAIEDEYASPELLQDNMDKPFASVVFSIGIMLDELRRGSTYWSEQGWNVNAFENELAAKGNWWLPVSDDDPLGEVIRACVAVNPEERPQTPQALAQLLNAAGIEVTEIDNDQAEPAADAEMGIDNDSEPLNDDATSEKNVRTGSAEATSADTVSVGIDLGTSYSTVSYYKDGRLHFLERV